MAVSRPLASRCPITFPHLSMAGGRTISPKSVSSGFPTRFPVVRPLTNSHDLGSGSLTFAPVSRPECWYPQERIQGHPQPIPWPIYSSVWRMRPTKILVRFDHTVGFLFRSSDRFLFKRRCGRCRLGGWTWCSRLDLGKFFSRSINPF